MLFSPWPQWSCICKSLCPRIFLHCDCVWCWEGSCLGGISNIISSSSEDKKQLCSFLNQQAIYPHSFSLFVRHAYMQHVRKSKLANTTCATMCIRYEAIYHYLRQSATLKAMNAFAKSTKVVVEHKTIASAENAEKPLLATCDWYCYDLEDLSQFGTAYTVVLQLTLVCRSVTR